MTRNWGWPPWIDTSLALLAVIVVVGAVITGKRIAGLEREINAAGERRLPIHEPALTVTFAGRTVLLTAIVVLMVAKVDLAACLAVSAVAPSLGVALVLHSRRAHLRQRAANT